MMPQPSSPPERQTAKLEHSFVFNLYLRTIVKVFLETLHQSVRLASVIGERITTIQFNLKNRPFINPSLVGDPFGKEAVWETTIGDTKNVIKHINQHGSLAGWSLSSPK